ncbi:MAG: hypothetical protein GX455_04475 [Phycisphaerae bacterium]|nr:hypothetical protein [Phycisphaerae bacterium]
MFNRIRNSCLAVVACSLWICPWGIRLQAAEFECFDVTDPGEMSDGAMRILPWKTIVLDPEYGGQWVIAADLDNDGSVEIVSAENFNKEDTHYTSTAVAQRLDGTVLWKWGDPSVGRKTWHHDVACQIHDWNGDGNKEVILCTRGFLVELDGLTGRERRRIAIPDEATDCLVFCNLSGRSYPCEVLVKDRYHQIWAFDISGKPLWTIRDPGGYRTAHQPLPVDVDGDGCDEILAGYVLLNPDGSIRWTIQSSGVDLSKGHLDCARVLRAGTVPEDFRLAVTYCGANALAMLDGKGKTLWERTGHHFESIDIGKVLPDHSGPHIVVDIDHQPAGQSPIWVLDKKGSPLGQIITGCSRHHLLIDWTGDGLDEIVVADFGGMYDSRGRRIATLITPGSVNRFAETGFENSILAGDMSGDGIADILLVTPDTVYIYKNPEGKKPSKPIPLGTEFNFTLY